MNNSYFFSKSVTEFYLRQAYKDATGTEIPAKTLEALSVRGYQEFFARASKMITENPDILFIAGTDNSGTNLDTQLYYPQHVDADNVIVVQASHELIPVAFTGHGKRSVDIAAPAVNQFYALPGNMYSIASATSLAVPYVSNIAARMLEINPALSPVELKTIILSTAWKLPAFFELNASGGVINSEACIEAVK